MIYVFLVDTGTMMTFDMNLALENVSVLKEVINRAMKVPPEKQVLLISGGEALDPNQRVCQYSAGTDTNPIFLFSKTTIEGQTPPSPSIDYGTDTDLKDQVEGALNMPASYNTVVARAQLAQQFHEHSRDQTRTCQQLVHDQHLQQQGWAAVVANLEDIVSAFKNRFENFESSFNECLKGRDEKSGILENFEEDLKLLSRIPVLPALLGERKRKNESQHGGKVDETENNAEEDKDGIEGCEAKPTMSLLDWISAKDSQSNVGQIAQLCYRGLTQINEGMLTQLASEVNSVSHEADRPQMKEIKGLGERLFGLEQLMHEANKIVQEQNNFAQALIQNQNRAGKVNDPSIFPDLCTSHRKNLMHMLKNHQRVQDIKRRCIKAKEELSENLHVRLKWIMYIEKKLYELDNKLTMHHENVRRVTGLLQVIEQIHRAPRVYVSAITEVARRHTFSKSFVQWATALSTESSDVWQREVTTRRHFIHQFSSHFLASLFPGMDDLPPDFATQPPDTFDDTLPNLTEENIEQLRAILPELASMLVVGEVISIPPLLQVALQSHTSNTHSPRSSEVFLKEGSGDMYTSAVTTAASVTPRNTPDRDGNHRGQQLRPLSLTREHHESETDTEEFEKVGCSGGSDGTFSPMEVMPDNSRGSMKTKQHFSTQVNDSKHIKLDGGTGSTSPVGGAVQEELRPGTVATRGNVASPASPQDPAISPESMLTSQEFVTAEYYIDESMPSSYTESGGTAASCSRHPPPMVKTHHVITAELQQQLEDKNSAILNLQTDLTQAKEEVDQLQQRLSALASLQCQDEVLSLKSELASLRGKVRDEGETYVNYISELSSRILDVLLQVYPGADIGRAGALISGDAGQADQDRLQEQLRGTVDLQSHKLNDAQREIEMYQEQLHRHQETLQQTTVEFEEAKRLLIEEKVEAVKRLTLEHELEMVNLKERWQEDDSSRQEEIIVLTQKLKSLEETLQCAERERSDLENNFKERFAAHIQEEKDKIVKILEVSFSEREKNALESLREQLINEHQAHVSRLLKEKEEAIQAACEEVRTKLVVEWREVVDQQHKDLTEKHAAHYAQCKHQWEQEKRTEIADKVAEIETRWRDERDSNVEHVRQQYKMELEGLRSRFRMMTTASMDKSPSETSLEKFERGDFLDMGAHEAALARLREELLKEKEVAIEETKIGLQEQFGQVRRDELQKHETMRKDERRRIEAEKQIVFNDAIKSVSQDKERVIEDLRLRVELLTDETEKLRRLMHNAATGSTDHLMSALVSENEALKERCEILQKDITRLEGEVLRVKRLSFVVTPERPTDLSMSFTESGASAVSPSGSLSANEDVRKLQQENQELRDKLRPFMPGPGNVLLVWDDHHLHYRVLLEGNPHLHFLHLIHTHTLASNHLHVLFTETPHKMYCTAEVVSKEFCQAKKVSVDLCLSSSQLLLSSEILIIVIILFK
ncbi:RB1-inducible coiled-coil protein 1-like [Homarus americanus]|uniref:RB1-inducible coiled-coil protein 1-like n=1 Tax=Homarus americanus TaxID=6706 RepID=UPI001C43DA4C|nr:RB1-inducible coiled-coil protein 1-like [Homarus americanus]